MTDEQAATEPSMEDPRWEYFADVSYRGETEAYWKLDLAVPRAPRRRPIPLLVLVHGGGWSMCTKRSEMEIALTRHFAAAGYAVAAVEYRLVDVAPHPAQLSDVRCALRFLRAHADRWGLDPQRFAISGHSSGAHLAMMAALIRDAEWSEHTCPWRESSSDVQAVASLSGAYDYDRAEWDPATFFPAALIDLVPGPSKTLQERVHAAMPLAYVRADAPPLLLVHGTEDRGICSAAAGRKFAEAMRAAGAPDVTLHIAEGLGHMLSDELILAQLTPFLERTIG